MRFRELNEEEKHTIYAAFVRGRSCFCLNEHWRDSLVAYRTIQGFTICVLKTPIGLIVGASRCSKWDKFNGTRGERLALLRAVSQDGGLITEGEKGEESRGEEEPKRFLKNGLKTDDAVYVRLTPLGKATAASAQLANEFDGPIETNGEWQRWFLPRLMRVFGPYLIKGIFVDDEIRLEVPGD